MTGISPAPRAFVRDTSKTPPVWTDLTPFLRGWVVGGGARLNRRRGQLKIVPVAGHLRLRNDSAAFAYGNRTWWAAPRRLHLYIGSVRVFRGYALPVSSEPYQPDPHVEWPVFGLTGPAMGHVSKPWEQTDMTAAASQPRAILRRLLAAYGFTAGAEAGESWVHPASINPRTPWALSHVVTDGPLAVDLDELALASMSGVWDSLDGRIVMAAFDQALNSVPAAPVGQKALAHDIHVGTVATALRHVPRIVGALTSERSEKHTVTFTVPVGTHRTVVELDWPAGAFDVMWAAPSGDRIVVNSWRVEPAPSGQRGSDVLVVDATATVPTAVTMTIEGTVTEGRIVGSDVGSYRDDDPFVNVISTAPWIAPDSSRNLAPADAYADLVSSQRREARLTLPMTDNPTSVLPQNARHSSNRSGQLIPGRVVGYGIDGGDTIRMLPLYVQLEYDLDLSLPPIAVVDGISYDQAPQMPQTPIGPETPGGGNEPDDPDEPDLDAPVVNIAAAVGAVLEGSPAVFTLTAVPAPSATVPVTVEVTSTGDNIASGQLGERVVALDSARTVLSIPTLRDASESDPEGTVSVRVLARPGYHLASIVTAATVRIEHQSDPRPTVSIAPKSVSVDEGDPAVFTVTAQPAPTSPLVVGLNVAQTGSFVAAGDLGAKTVTIPISGAVDYSVATFDDNMAEPDGTVTVQVTADAANYLLASFVTAATVRVEDAGVPTPSAAAPRIIATLTGIQVHAATRLGTRGYAIVSERNAGSANPRQPEIRILTPAGAFSSRFDIAFPAVGNAQRTANRQIEWDRIDMGASPSLQRIWVTPADTVEAVGKAAGIWAFTEAGTAIPAATRSSRTVEANPGSGRYRHGMAVRYLTADDDFLYFQEDASIFSGSRFVDTERWWIEQDLDDDARVRPWQGGFGRNPAAGQLGVYRWAVAAGDVRKVAALVRLVRGQLIEIFNFAVSEGPTLGPYRLPRVTPDLPDGATIVGFDIDSTGFDPSDNSGNIAVVAIRLSNNQVRLIEYELEAAS